MKNVPGALAVVLFGLCAAQWLRAEPFAYIPHSGGVSVVDVGTHRLVTEIATPGSNAGGGVAAKPGDPRVYVASGRVFAIDSRAQAAVASMPELAPTKVALNPTRAEAYVGNEPAIESTPGPRVIAINTDTKTDAGVIAQNGMPTRIATNADGTRLYVLGGSALAVYDTASRQLVGGFGVPDATAFILHPSRNQVFVAANNRIDLYDLSSGAVVATIPTPIRAADMAIDSTGNRLFLSYLAGSAISVIDVQARAIIATINVGANSSGIDITPNGEKVFVVNGSDDSVTVIDAVGLRAIDTIRVGSGARAIGRFIGGIGATPSPPDVLSGLWWNPAEPGWGVHVSHRGSRIFAAWFTYNAAGAPKWYISSDCVMNSQLPTPPATGEATCSGNIYETTGPRFFSDPFNPGAVTVTKLGLFQMGFSDSNTGAMSFVIGNSVKTMTLRRQVFAAGGTPGADYSDLWWNPSESGWGIGITQQGGIMFLAWFAYDDTGTPMWYVASSCTVNATGNGCSGVLYRTSGPVDPLRNPFDPSKVAVTAVGTITASFSDGNTGTLSYTVDGKAGTKQIQRQLF